VANEHDIDWVLIGRYALLIALTVLIPIPLLDTTLENMLRRRLVRAVALRHGVDLSDEQVATLGNAPGGGCLGCFWGLVTWPFRKILRTVLIVLQLKVIADLASEIVHRSLLLEEALELGFLPDQPDRVRVAMDKALVAVDTRVVERRLLGVFKEHTSDLNRVVWEATKVAKGAANEQRNQALADAVEADTLGSGAREMTAALAASLGGIGMVPELLAWFRAELMSGPAEVGGVVEPEVLPADERTPKSLPEPKIEDAEELPEGEE
jgi:hypothetical protein